MNVHVGSGSVYLDGWTNIDIPGPRTFLAAERPDLVGKWKTTEDDYYGRHRDVTIDSLRDGPRDSDYVCDRYGSFEFLPVRKGEVAQCLTRQAFEHLSSNEASHALLAIHAAMRPYGILRIDVPDHVETLRLLMETHDPFYVRHLLGPKRGEHGVHMQSYSVEGLRALVEAHGFGFMEREPDIHLYPSICLRFLKKP